MTQSLETVGQLRDQMVEAIFHAIYGSAGLQASLGMGRSNGRVRPKPGISPHQRAALVAKNVELRTAMNQGGPLEAAVRAHVYIAMGQKSVDARSFEVLRRVLKDVVKAHPGVTLGRYKALVRQQWAMLTHDQQAALNALPRLLPADADERRQLFDEMTAVIIAAGELDGEAKRRFDEIKALFDVKTAPAGARQSGRVEAAL